MAKKVKYDEEKLLEAVVKYAPVCTGKIKATDLAEWASSNIPGLEGVQSYHFLRPITFKNSKTGKQESRDRLCKIKMDEINSSRNITSSFDSSVLLSSASIDAFFELTRAQQRNEILEARNQVQALTKNYNRLKKEHDIIKFQSKEIAALKEQIEKVLVEIRKDKQTASKQIKFLISHVDEAERLRLLEDKGIFNNNFDITQYVKHMTEKENRLINFKDVLYKYYQLDSIDDTEASSNSTSDTSAANELGNLFLID